MIENAIASGINASATTIARDQVFSWVTKPLLEILGLDHGSQKNSATQRQLLAGESGGSRASRAL